MGENYLVVEGMLAAWCAVLLGAMVQGMIGFGFAIVAAPLLLILQPDWLPVPLMIAGFFLNLITMLREKEAADQSGVIWASIGHFPGAWLGAWLLTWLSPDVTAQLMGGMILFAILLSAMGIAVEPNKINLLLAGFISGTMGTVSTVGGPAMAMLYQNSHGPQLRGTLATFFFFGNIVSLWALAHIGRLNEKLIHTSLALLPAVVIGLLLSHSARHKIDQGKLKPAVLALSFLASLSVIWPF